MTAVSAEWQAKRARLIEIYGGACTYCGAKGVRLNVHHRYYENGKQIWDYSEETLDCLCNKCHGMADEVRRKLARSSGFLDICDSWRAIGYMDGILLSNNPCKNVRLRNCSHARGIGDAFGISENDVIGTALSTDGVVTGARLEEIAKGAR